VDDDQAVLDALDREIQALEDKYAQLAAQHDLLSQKVERLYQELLSEFDQRWPPLKTVE